jgi:hypothetical protein
VRARARCTPACCFRGAQEALTQRLDAATSSHASVYVGLAGVSFFFLRLSLSRARDGDAAGAAAALARADAALDAAHAARHKPRGPSFLEGTPGLLALRACIAAAAGRADAAAAAAARLVAMEADVARLPRGECELLYGRAGYLHACLLARTAAPAAVPASLLARTAGDILAAGAADADARGAAFARKWGLLFTWHGSDYLGAAHGLAGILLTLLQTEATLREGGSSGSGGGAAAAAVAFSEGDAARIRAATLALSGSLLPSGNLPTRYGIDPRGAHHEDRLVQWCHGAPGFLLLAAAAGRHAGAAGTPAARLARPAAAAADCVWCVQHVTSDVHDALAS